MFCSIFSVHQHDNVFNSRRPKSSITRDTVRCGITVWSEYIWSIFYNTWMHFWFFWKICLCLQIGFWQCRLISSGSVNGSSNNRVNRGRWWVYIQCRSITWIFSIMILRLFYALMDFLLLPLAYFKKYYLLSMYRESSPVLMFLKESTFF